MSSVHGERWACQLRLLAGGKVKAPDCALSWVLGENETRTGAWTWSRSADELRIDVQLTVGVMTLSFKAARMAPERVLVSLSGVPPNGTPWPAEEHALERCRCAVQELCVSKR